jgi:hypothetical protein
LARFECISDRFERRERERTREEEASVVRGTEERERVERKGEEKRRG